MSAEAASTKSVVLVVGGSGNTGSFVVEALLQSGHFNVIVLTRPGSEGKSRIQSLKKKGAEIRLGDFFQASVAELEKLLEGVDIVLSLVNIMVIEDQKRIFQAAKNVGVQRVVPSEFAFPCPQKRGQHLFESKRAVRFFIEELGIGYTIIDVGWWMELILPYLPSDQSPVAGLSHTFVGAGDVKVAVTSRGDIGRFTARILADPRTLNKHVFCHAEQLTQTEVYRIAEEVSGQNFDSVKNHVSANALAEQISQSKEQLKNNPSDGQIRFKLMAEEYLNSLFVFGDNTLKNAKKLGALDARELYPDFEPVKLKEYAVEFYKSPPRFE